MELNRRSFLLSSAGASAAVAGSLLLGADPAFAELVPRPDGTTLTSKTALNYLKAGNKRWAARKPLRKSYAPKGKSVVDGQWPVAGIVSCADSRVQPDELFDMAPANLFIARNAGNVVDEEVLGTLEYGVEHLGISLIVALGHSLCGAVKATEAALAKGGTMPGGNIDVLVNRIKPALKALPAGHSLEAAVEANAEQSAKLIESKSSIIEEAIAAGDVKVVAATYDLATRKVIWH